MTLAVHVTGDDSGSMVVSDESVESHSGAFVKAARSSCSCCNSTSPTRGIDVSVGTSVDSVDDATVDEVDDATVDEVEVLVDVVVAGCVVVVVDPPDAERTHHDCCPINARFALPPLLEGEASSRVGGVASSSFFWASSSFFWASSMAASFTACVSKHKAELRRPLRLLDESDPPQAASTSAVTHMADIARTKT